VGCDKGLAPSAPPVATVAEPEPLLTIVVGATERHLTRGQLLERADLQPLTIQDESAYEGRALECEGISAQALFQGLDIPGEAALTFTATDGFSATISAARVLANSENAARGFLAIERSDKPWPRMRPTRPSAGTFYWVWKDPQKSDIGREEWPFKIRRIEVTLPFAARFPGLLPDAALAKDAREHRGFEVFQKDCSPCHTLNRQGGANVGPDLNEPMSPTEYFPEAVFRTLIRNPQSVRHFPNSKMSGFSKEILPDSEVDDLLAYLRHMAARRKTTP
jgi:mono/diheme cytochrome c family protein